MCAFVTYVYVYQHIIPVGSDISIQDHKREASILIPVLMLPGCQVHTRLFGPLIPFVLTSQNKTCLPNFSFLLTQRVAGRAVPPGKSQVRAVPLRVSLQHNPSKIKPAAGYALLAQGCAAHQTLLRHIRGGLPVRIVRPALCLCLQSSFSH